MASHNTTNTNNSSINESSSFSGLKDAFLKINADEISMNSDDDTFYDSHVSSQNENDTTESTVSSHIYNSTESRTSNNESSTALMSLPTSTKCIDNSENKDIGNIYYFPPEWEVVEIQENRNYKPYYYERNTALLRSIHKEVCSKVAQERELREKVQETPEGIFKLSNTNDALTFGRLNTVLDDTEKSSTVIETDDSSYIMKKCMNMNTSTDFYSDSNEETSESQIIGETNLGFQNVSFSDSMSQCSFFTAISEESTFSSDPAYSIERNDTVESTDEDQKHDLRVTKVDTKNSGKKRRSTSLTLDCTKANEIVTRGNQGREHHFCTPVRERRASCIVTSPIKSVNNLIEYFSHIGKQGTLRKSPWIRKKKGPNIPFIIITPSTPH